MNPSRRGFLGFLAAPAIVQVANLMPISDRLFRAPRLWGDGIHDDSAAIQWLLDNEGFANVVGKKLSLERSIVVSRGKTLELFGCQLTFSKEVPAFIVIEEGKMFVDFSTTMNGGKDDAGGTPQEAGESVAGASAFGVSADRTEPDQRA